MHHFDVTRIQFRKWIIYSERKGESCSRAQQDGLAIITDKRGLMLSEHLQYVIAFNPAAGLRNIDPMVTLFKTIYLKGTDRIASINLPPENKYR